VKAATHNTPLPTDVFLQVISDVSIKTVEPKPRVINLIQGEDWRALIMAYLRNYYEPDNIIEHTMLQYRAWTYQIVDNNLYKSSISCPSFGVSIKPKVKRYYWRFAQELAEAT
jgi:hypothetical protein